MLIFFGMAPIRSVIWLAERHLRIVHQGAGVFLPGSLSSSSGSSFGSSDMTVSFTRRDRYRHRFKAGA
jgi:hypothetical protein